MTSIILILISITTSTKVNISLLKKISKYLLKIDYLKILKIFFV